ncbi:hypothetical protein NP493_352g01071 [Ridgeia piscesae]|uniref:Secreted protein n=1 Tax=Ridgeia piscesae TaxID=27915 RepID=A0AAD9L3E5_RIDPI|nr:hypothetical protein NP493_352g01071 [Ridgeia piscesae]
MALSILMLRSVHVGLLIHLLQSCRLYRWNRLLCQEVPVVLVYRWHHPGLWLRWSPHGLSDQLVHHGPCFQLLQSYPRVPSSQ